jgi:HEAT repeat protein
MSITPESVGELLRSPSLGDRLQAVNQIRTLPPADGFTLIQHAVEDTNARVRYAAVSQLSSLGQQDQIRTLDILRQALHDPEPDVQAAAADSIGALQLTDAFEDLERLYHSTSEWLVQFSILAALGELGDGRSFSLLEEALQSPNELMKMAAIGSLGELGDERAVQLLIQQASSLDWQIRHRVAQALSRLGTPEAKSTLEQLAKDTAEPVAQEAKAGLGM